MKIKKSLDLDRRKPLWLALSDLYLDTELQDYDFKFIVKIFHQSGYTFKEIRQIDKEEVFPILYSNLLSVAGVWDGFQEEWLFAGILSSIRKRNAVSKIRNNFLYKTNKWICVGYWEKLEVLYKGLDNKKPN